MKAKLSSTSDHGYTFWFVLWVATHHAWRLKKYEESPSGTLWDVTVELGFSTLVVFVVCLALPVWALDLESKVGTAKYLPLIPALLVIFGIWANKQKILDCSEQQLGPGWAWNPLWRIPRITTAIMTLFIVAMAIGAFTL